MQSDIEFYKVLQVVQRLAGELGLEYVVEGEHFRVRVRTTGNLEVVHALSFSTIREVESYLHGYAKNKTMQDEDKATFHGEIAELTKAHNDVTRTLKNRVIDFERRLQDRTERVNDLESEIKIRDDATEKFGKIEDNPAVKQLEKDLEDMYSSKDLDQHGLEMAARQIGLKYRIEDYHFFIETPDEPLGKRFTLVDFEAHLEYLKEKTPC